MFYHFHGAFSAQFCELNGMGQKARRLRNLDRCSRRSRISTTPFSERIWAANHFVRIHRFDEPGLHGGAMAQSQRANAKSWGRNAGLPQGLTVQKTLKNLRKEYSLEIT